MIAESCLPLAAIILNFATIFDFVTCWPVSLSLTVAPVYSILLANDCHLRKEPTLVDARAKTSSAISELTG
ncbi:MAG TPA: hypothetical protein PKE16_16920, partial [Hyphomicrobium sp.]|nr:hypothetical protein [Hyphomicrobium sp.]